MLTQEQFNELIAQIGTLYECFKDNLISLTLMPADERARIQMFNDLASLRNIACEQAQANYPGFAVQKMPPAIFNAGYEAEDEELERLFCLAREYSEEKKRFYMPRERIEILKTSLLLSERQRHSIEVLAAMYIIKVNENLTNVHENITA